MDIYPQQKCPWLRHFVELSTKSTIMCFVDKLWKSGKLYFAPHPFCKNSPLTSPAHPLHRHTFCPPVSKRFHSSTYQPACLAQKLSAPPTTPLYYLNISRPQLRSHPPPLPLAKLHYTIICLRIFDDPTLLRFPKTYFLQNLAKGA